MLIYIQFLITTNVHITYVCSYLTKDETECSQAIVNAAKEAFLSKREVSSQECVNRCMPELWLRKIFPTTVFVSTDLPEKRVRVTKSKNRYAMRTCVYWMFVRIN